MAGFALGLVAGEAVGVYIGAGLADRASRAVVVIDAVHRTLRRTERAADHALGCAVAPD